VTQTDTQNSAEHDVIVIGGGPTGENVADRVVRGGLTAVIVEAELVGGECSYWACMPSKALLRPIAALAEAAHVEGSRQAVTGKVDAAAVLERRNSFTHNWADDSQVQWLAGAHIDLCRGHGRLAGERTVVVDGPDTTMLLTARHAVVVATGTKAVIPPIPGLAEVRPWTSREATSARTVPGRLAVLGGGVVGCEMATAWAGLGSKVTLLVRESRVLPRVEAFAGELAVSGMTSAGVDVRLGRSAVEVHRAGPDAPVVLSLDDGSILEADEVLVAVGRSPATSDIGLESVGLTPGDWLDVDDTLQVASIDGGWLYAAGDVNHRALLTHMGKYQARVCGDVIAARARGENVQPGPWTPFAATADHAAVPQVVFTTPEVAAVGRTEQEARDAGIRVRTVDYDIGNVAGASLYADGYQGHARIVVDEDRRVIVGMTLAGPAVGEMIHAGTIAVVGEVPIDRLWHAVPSYPTIGELWLRLLETYGL